MHPLIRVLLKSFFSVCLLATVSNMSILDALDNLKAALFGHTRYA